MNRRIVLLALLLVPGCKAISNLGDSVGNGLFATNRGRIPFGTDGFGTKNYAVTMDRCWMAVENAARATGATLDPASRSGAEAHTKGRTKDGRPLEVRAMHPSNVTTIAVKVGLEDTQDNRNVSIDFHEHIDSELQVVCRHYPAGFDQVWDASQKSTMTVEQKVQPDDKTGQIAGRTDGAAVIITIERIDEKRTRVTIEVGKTASAETRKQAVDLAKQISQALGVKPEEGD